MRSKIGDKQRLIHIWEALSEIEIFTKDVDYESFKANSILRLACVKLLEIIGEAATMTTEGLKVAFPEIEWRVLKGMRNAIVHEYFGINYEIVWESIQRDVPKLKDKVGHILENHVFE